MAFEADNTPTANQSSQVTLERFFNTQTGVHNYSASAKEASAIKHGSAGANWVNEGAGFTVHVPMSDLHLL